MPFLHTFLLERGIIFHIICLRHCIILLSFHNNNQAWLTHHQQPMPANLEHPHHQPHPAEAPDSVQPHQMYPPMNSFGYHNGHANGYHETHFDQHNHHADSVRYDAAYNQQPR